MSTEQEVMIMQTYRERKLPKAITFQQLDDERKTGSSLKEENINNWTKWTPAREKLSKAYTLSDFITLRKWYFAAVWNVRLVPTWGLWLEPIWAWSRVSFVSSNPASEMSPALRASWEMSTNADLGPPAEGGASLSLWSSLLPSSCSQQWKE